MIYNEQPMLWRRKYRLMYDSDPHTYDDEILEDEEVLVVGESPICKYIDDFSYPMSQGFDVCTIFPAFLNGKKCYVLHAKFSPNRNEGNSAICEREIFLTEEDGDEFLKSQLAKMDVDEWFRTVKF